MKFVCDNCQAKYQIGDDKVAGKTVRMKCRKCGYNIKVSASGTAEAMPPDPPSNAGIGRDAVPPPPVSMLQAVTAPTAPSSSPGWTEGEDESTSIMNAPVRDAVAAAIAAARAPAPAPVPAGAPARPAPFAPRPAGATGAVPAPLAPRPAGATGAAPAPVAPRPVTGTSAPHPRPAALGETSKPPARPAAQPRPVTRQTMPPGTSGPTRPGHSSPAVAAVRHEPTPSPLSQAAPAAAELEWYVGVAGSPIGPVRVAVIRERALAGEVDGESLVWREGQAEWRALRTFPDLLAAITPATAPAPAPTPAPFAAMSALSAPVGGPASASAPSTPASAPVSAARPAATPAPIATAPVPAAPVAAAPAPVAATPTPAPVAAAPVQQPVAPVAPTPSPFIVASAPVAAPASALTDPFAPAPNGAAKANGFHPSGVEAAAPAALLDAPSAPAPAPAKPLVDIDPTVEAALIPRRGNTHPMAYAFIAAAAVFGGVAAYVLLSKPPTPQIVVVQAPPPTATPSATPSAVPDDKGIVDVGDPLVAPGASARPGLGKAWPKASGAPSATATAHDATPLDTSGIINNVPGPQATAPSGPSAGGQLSQGEMNAVVAQNQPRVRRKCWQPALDGQAANGPKNARVMVAIGIGASGNVDSASATGAERDFPGLASCIAGTVRGWKFPPSGGPTQVNVPFVFAGQ